MRAEHVICFWAFFGHCVLSSPSFIYPPALQDTTDPSQNIIMTEGNFEFIRWKDVDNPNGQNISVTIWQLIGTSSVGGFEYVIQNAPPDTAYVSWTVNTNKDLTVSPTFNFNLFLEGETSDLTNSHPFNISATSSATTSSSFSSSTTSSTTSSTMISTTSIQPSANSPATTAPSPMSPIPTPAPSGLSTEAKVGIAIGVIGAILISVLAGWLFLGRQRRSMEKTQSPEPATTHPPVQTTPYERINAEQQRPYEVHGEALPPVSYELAPQMGQHAIH